MNIQNKYRTILEAKENEIHDLEQLSINDPLKPNYHIHPTCGLLNDPNGLAYYNGKYRLFYQWYPFGPIHGMKHWAQLESSDLADWTRLGVGITPTEDYEKQGAYSGNAIEIDGKLYLYYTGNIKIDDNNRSANQCLAIMDENGNIEKHPHNPLIKGVPQGYTGHVRDPKVFKKGEYYYMMLGAQRLDETGTFIMYKSKEGINWELLGELKVDDYNGNLGYMWECPDYINIDGRDVLIFSPQGIEPENYKYKNLFNVVYMIGNLDIDNLEFKVEQMEELDCGFDFYAPQTFKGKDDKALMFAWAGMDEFKAPTDENKWANCLTFARQLTIRDGRIYQLPVDEIEKLRENKIEVSANIMDTLEIENKNNSYELNLDINSKDANIFGIELLSSDEDKLVLTFNKANNTITLDKSNMSFKFAEEFGLDRTTTLKSLDEVKIKALVDNSIVEIFINDGEKAFTARVFPKQNSTKIKVFTNSNIEITGNKYELRKGI